MDFEDLLLVAWAAAIVAAPAWAAWRIHKALERLRADDEMANSMTSDFRRDAGDIPDVADSPAWSENSSPQARTSMRDALEVVLSEGASRASCGACGSTTTTIEPQRWEKYGPLPHQTYLMVLETCSNCDDEQTYRLGASAWVALAAFRAWDQFDQADETLDLSVRTQAEIDEATDLDSVNQDLRDLDEGSDD